MLTGLAMVVVLSFLLLSPWPRWTISSPAQSPAAPPLQQPIEGWSGKGPESEYAGVPASGLDNSPVPKAEDTQGMGMNAGDDRTFSAKDQPSHAAILGQTTLDELAKPQATAPTSDWQWPEALAVLLLAAMAGGLGWLMLGVAAVRWQRLRSRPVVDTALRELIDVLCAELGCRRTVEVRQSDDLTTAATIGWRRPGIAPAAQLENLDDRPTSGRFGTRTRPCPQ